MKGLQYILSSSFQIIQALNLYKLLYVDSPKIDEAVPFYLPPNIL